VLDAGALSAAAEGDTRVRAELAVPDQLGVDVHVTSVTLAETLRGQRRDARVQAVMAGTVNDPVTPALGRAAGELLGVTGRDDTVDGVVAVTAESLGAASVFSPATRATQGLHRRHGQRHGHAALTTRRTAEGARIAIGDFVRASRGFKSHRVHERSPHGRRICWSRERPTQRRRTEGPSGW